MVWGKASLAVRGLRIHSLGQALNSSVLGWGVIVRFQIPVLFFMKHLLRAQHHPAFSMHFLI